MSFPRKACPRKRRREPRARARDHQRLGSRPRFREGRLCAGMTKIPLMRGGTTSVSSRAGRPEDRCKLTMTLRVFRIPSQAASRRLALCDAQFPQGLAHRGDRARHIGRRDRADAAHAEARQFGLEKLLISTPRAFSASTKRCRSQAGSAGACTLTMIGPCTSGGRYGVSPRSARRHTACAYSRCSAPTARAGRPRRRTGRAPR